jgi:hypothetical protein
MSAKVHTILPVRWLKSEPTVALTKAPKVDADEGIIYGVVMAEEGPARGHGVELDEAFIRDVVRYDRAHYQDRGLKARFGHPSMSNEVMGTQMGFFKNYRVQKAARNGQTIHQAVADLHLLAAANESPTHPGMREWVLKMAQEAPDFMMCSIVFMPQMYFQRDAEGKKVKVEYDAEYGWLTDPEMGPVYAQLADHYYTDLVEQGAATEKLFSAQFNPDNMAVRAAEWLSDNPAVIDLLEKTPAKALDFLTRVGINVQPMTTLIGKLLGSSTPPPAPAAEITVPVVTEDATQKEAVAEDEELIAEDVVAKQEDLLNEQMSAMSELVENLVKSVVALQKRVEALQADAEQRLQQLEQAPAATHTGGAVSADATNEPKWLTHLDTKRQTA